MNFKYLGLLLASCAAISGCGGEGGTPLDGQNGPMVVGQLKAALGKLPTSNSTPTLPVGGVTTSGFNPLALSCETASPAVTVDADSDGIALEKVYTFDCSSETDGDSTVDRKGTMSFFDKDDTVAGMFGGMRAEFDITQYHSQNQTNGFEFDYTYKGFWDYQKIGSNLESDVDFTGTVKYSYNSLKNNYQFRYLWDWKLSPTDLNDPWDSGTVEFSGKFLLSGDFVTEVSGNHTQQSGNFAITYESKDLVYAHSECSQWYKSGSIEFFDGANTMKVVYSCTSAKFYVNGQESDWWQ